jgi:hypothetical protein
MILDQYFVNLEMQDNLSGVQAFLQELAQTGKLVLYFQASLIKSDSGLPDWQMRVEEKFFRKFFEEV